MNVRKRGRQLIWLERAWALPGLRYHYSRSSSSHSALQWRADALDGRACWILRFGCRRSSGNRGWGTKGNPTYASLGKKKCERRRLGRGRAQEAAGRERAVWKLELESGFEFCQSEAGKCPLSIGPACRCPPHLPSGLRRPSGPRPSIEHRAMAALEYGSSPTPGVSVSLGPYISTVAGARKAKESARHVQRVWGRRRSVDEH